MPRRCLLHLRGDDCCSASCIGGRSKSHKDHRGLIAFGNGAEEFEIDDARRGKPLWAFNLGQAVHASPILYGMGGKQYFAVAAGDAVIAFALP